VRKDQLLDDEFFREDLAEGWRVKELKQLRDKIKKARPWLNINPYRPVKRRNKEGIEQSTAPTRQITNRLADSAFRFYANCDTAIMNNLLKYPWLEPISKLTMADLIKAALETKTDQYNRREPREDYIGDDLYGDWAVSRDIDPPWMKA